MVMKKLAATLCTLLSLQGCGGSDGGSSVPSGSYSLSGTVTGLSGTLTVDVNGTDEIISSNGDFNLTTTIIDGEQYTLTLTPSDENVSCTLVNGSGQSEQNVTNIEINCDATVFKAYSLNGLDFSVEAPSVVTFAFHLVDRYTGTALDNLTEDTITDYLKVTENDLKISPSESFLELDTFSNLDAEYHTVFAIDISSSLSARELESIVDIVKQAIVDESTNESKLSANQYISIITFDSDVEEVLLQSQNTSDIITALDNLSVGGNSTNLFGAIEHGLGIWQNEITLDSLTYGNLILFTDGNDTSSKVSKSDALEAAENKDMYFITIGDETDSTILKEFTNKNNIFSISNFDDFSSVLQQTFDRVKTYEDGLYVLSYATPKRAGNQTLKIEAIDDYRCDTPVNEAEQEQITDAGELVDCHDDQSYDFNADNFTDVEAELSLTGAKVTTSTETMWIADLRWSNETPIYDWNINVCLGDVSYNQTENDSKVTFTRNTSDLVVAYVTLTEDVTGNTFNSYLLMAQDSSSFSQLSINILEGICNN